MRLSAPLHTSLHPINRHTAGAAGKLIFLLFFPLLPSLLADPAPFPPPPAVALPELGAVSPHAGWDVSLGFPELAPRRWGQGLSLLRCLSSPEHFGPCHPRAGPGSLCRAPAPAAWLKVAEVRFLLSLWDKGLPGMLWLLCCDFWWPVGAFVWSKCDSYILWLFSPLGFHSLSDWCVPGEGSY